MGKPSPAPRPSRDHSSTDIQAKPLDASLTVNTCDALSFLTGNYIKSTIHRVSQPPADQSNFDRLGLLYFNRPQNDLKLATIDSPVLKREGYTQNEFEKGGHPVPTMGGESLSTDMLLQGVIGLMSRICYTQAEVAAAEGCLVRADGGATDHSGLCGTYFQVIVRRGTSQKRIHLSPSSDSSRFTRPHRSLSAILSLSPQFYRGLYMCSVQYVSQTSRMNGKVPITSHPVMRLFVRDQKVGRVSVSHLCSSNCLSALGYRQNGQWQHLPAQGFSDVARDRGVFPAAQE